MSSWCTSLAIPKSVTLHFSPSPTRTFLAAKSRWIIYMTKHFHNGFFKNRIEIKIIFFLKLYLGPPQMSPVSKISVIYLWLKWVHMRGWADSVPQISRAVFPTRILETGLKFHIWTQGEIGPGNRAHLKRPVNLVSFYHDSSLKTIAWYRKKGILSNTERSFFFWTNHTLNLKFVVARDNRGNHFVLIWEKKMRWYFFVLFWVTVKNGHC